MHTAPPAAPEAPSVSPPSTGETPPAPDDPPCAELPALPAAPTSLADASSTEDFPPEESPAEPPAPAATAPGSSPDEHAQGERVTSHDTVNRRGQPFTRWPSVREECFMTLKYQSAWTTLHPSCASRFRILRFGERPNVSSLTLYTSEGESRTVRRARKLRGPTACWPTKRTDTSVRISASRARQDPPASKARSGHATSTSSSFVSSRAALRKSSSTTVPLPPAPKEPTTCCHLAPFTPAGQTLPPWSKRSSTSGSIGFDLFTKPTAFPP